MAKPAKRETISARTFMAIRRNADTGSEWVNIRESGPTAATVLSWVHNTKRELQLWDAQNPLVGVAEFDISEIPNTREPM